MAWRKSLRQQIHSDSHWVEARKLAVEVIVRERPICDIVYMQHTQHTQLGIAKEREKNDSDQINHVHMNPNYVNILVMHHTYKWKKGSNSTMNNPASIQRNTTRFRYTFIHPHTHIQKHTDRHRHRLTYHTFTFTFRENRNISHKR